MRPPTDAWKCVRDLAKITEELLTHVSNRTPIHPSAEVAMRNRLKEIVDYVETSGECESP